VQRSGGASDGSAIQANWLFVQSGGQIINPQTINFWLNKFRTQHNLKKFTPHSLRHTFISLSLAAGVDIKTLQTRSGHANPSTLLNVYAHVLESENAKAALKLEKILNQKKPEATGENGAELN
jgi:integrase